MASSRAINIDQTLRASFERVEQAVRYRRWVLDQARPVLGQRVLEVGCGVGNFTADLLDRERVVALEPVDGYLRELHRRLGEPSSLRTVLGGLEDRELLLGLTEERLDSALLLNVLEHVTDDVGGLRNLAEMLEPGARIVIQVPAHEWLYGSADRALGHHRRYQPAHLRQVIDRAGLELQQLWQFNALGVLGWFVSGRLRREPMFSARQLNIYEAVVPLLRLLEPADGVPVGLSVMAVARVAG